MTVGLYHDFSDVEVIWRGLNQRTPFQSFEWNMLFWKHLRGSKDLFIWANDETILPCQLRTLGNFRILELIGARGTDYLDFVGGVGGLSEICDAIRGANICDVFRLEDIPEDSQLAVIDLPGMFVERQINVPCVTIPLPKKWSLRTTNDMTRARKRLERAFENIQFSFLDDIANLGAYLELHRSRQQSRGNREYLSEEAERFLYEYCMAMHAQGALFLGGLYLNGELVAGVISVAWKDKVFALYAGMSLTLKKYRVGWLLYEYILGEATKRQFREYDLSRGDEDYKVRLGGFRKHNMLIEAAPNQTAIREYKLEYKRQFAGVGYEPTAH